MAFLRPSEDRREQSTQMIGTRPKRNPAGRANAARRRDAAIARLRRARVWAIGAAGVFSLAFAALAHALAPGRAVSSAPTQTSAAPAQTSVGGTPANAGSAPGSATQGTPAGTSPAGTSPAGTNPGFQSPSGQPNAGPGGGSPSPSAPSVVSGGS